MIQTLQWRPGRAEARTVTGRNLPIVRADDVASFGDVVLWDSWPLLGQDQSIVRTDGGEWWFALGAPRRADPEARHGEARIYLLRRSATGFTLLGPALPAQFGPGSREWSGSAVLEGESVVLRFTAAGRIGDIEPSAEQRLFQTVGRLRDDMIDAWSPPEEIVAADEKIYAPVPPGPATPGAIKGFRDPEFFRDHAGRSWLLFTGSAAGAPGDHDGLVGLVSLEQDSARLCTPLVDAIGVNRELERPHIRTFEGRLYLFWSTQTSAFSPAVGAWPTGLYGACAGRMEGPWTPLNGDGLVAANPSSQPTQAYSWLVLPDGTVASFADHIVTGGATHFLGGFAPFTRLVVNKHRAVIEPLL